MRFDPCKISTDVDRLATAEEIVMAILQSPGTIDEFGAEFLRGDLEFPNDTASIPDSEFEFLFRGDGLPHADSIVN